MAYRISINSGFITNSSSVVHYFDKKLLDHPKVAAFMEAYEIGEGFVGDDLWYRSQCDSILISKASKERAIENLNSSNYADYAPSINSGGDEVIIIYGDEYDSLAQDFAHLLEQVAEEQGGGSYGSSEYN